MSRAKAFGLHLGFSVIVFLAVLYVLFGLWYPGVFFYLDGGLRGLGLIAVVDLVVGPLLTLVFFRPGKKGLLFDVSFIVVIQVAFLVYGVWTLYQHRPAVLAFYGDSFYSVGVTQFPDGAKEVSGLSAMLGGLPAMVYVRPPQDVEEAARIRREKMLKGETLLMSVGHYEPYDGYLVLPYGRELGRHLEVRQDSRGFIEKWLARRGATIDDYVFIPAHARFGTRLMVLEADTGEVVDVLDVGLGLYEDLPLKKDGI